MSNKTALNVCDVPGIARFCVPYQCCLWIHALTPNCKNSFFSIFGCPEGVRLAACWFPVIVNVTPTSATAECYTAPLLSWERIHVQTAQAFAHEFHLVNNPLHMHMLNILRLTAGKSYILPRHDFRHNEFAGNSMSGLVSTMICVTVNLNCTDNVVTCLQNAKFNIWQRANCVVTSDNVSTCIQRICFSS